MQNNGTTTQKHKKIPKGCQRPRRRRPPPAGSASGATTGGPPAAMLRIAPYPNPYTRTCQRNLLQPQFLIY